MIHAAIKNCASRDIYQDQTIHYIEFENILEQTCDEYIL